ncbi:MULTISPECIES: cbb3-type cytochrome c oxidase N-terminal domain-containing protein [unclassified Arenibacter]|uniref:cbb3-type cytochrome c oxidase N-terminal domain-containing protein n=1 Tax=unclassified Arenibacter TaxID=2615047 RepID=UPI000E34F141|nr:MULTISPECIES: cbb3-type cytochrome c oxidase N-terminal domain-containing protein [unclassified Arenibacter]MCM4162560.1 cytochrome C oxidase subunit III [Arenibacter sp. A80]RFT58138.1 cytochrome C oxidase subunit III [Arenibacter sp. P308M17]
MRNISPWWVRVPLIFFLIFGLMEYFIDSGDKPAFIAYPIALLFMLMVLFILVAIELILNSVENIMFQTLSPEAQKRYLEAKFKQWEWKWGKAYWKKITGNRPVGEEQEIILDHNYDGIRELDNNLPPWWVYMFYATIIFGVVYLARFHVFNDYTQDMEYDREVAEAQIAIEAYKKTAKGLVDANTVELLTDASDIKAGGAIYSANCVACHMPDGGGGIGPNLTDEYWILGGGIKNVFQTISEGGRNGKGMIAWKQTLKPAEIAQVASYILSEIHGKAPANPKAAEGEIWTGE